MISRCERYALFGTVIFLALGCSALEGITGKPKRPRATETVLISNVIERAGYLEATLGTSDGPLRLYFAADEICRGLLTEGSDVAYGGLGMLGEVTGDAGRCPATGTSSLRAWHDRQTRSQELGKPRATARFTKIHEDASVLMVRGRFPMARVLGWAADDLVAVLPVGEDCRSIAERGEAFMTYDRVRAPVFTLTRGDIRCEIQGLTQPLRR